MPDLDKLKPLELKGEKKPVGKKPVGKKGIEELPWVEYEEVPEEWEGDLVSIDQLEDIMIVVRDYRERDSQYEEGQKYVIAQIEIDGTKYILRCGSKPVVGAILHMAHQDKIPFRAIVAKRRSAKGRTYYCLTGPTTADEEE